MLIIQGEVLDETAVKKLVLNFEKKALKNREMRIKFPDQPEKFMESEIDLFEALQVNKNKYFILLTFKKMFFSFFCVNFINKLVNFYYLWAIHVKNNKNNI